MYAYAPNGSVILGTLERLSGRAEICQDSFTLTGKGTVDFEWEGGTEIFYDDQETVKLEGERLFLADDGTEWKESEIILEEKDREDEE